MNNAAEFEDGFTVDGPMEAFQQPDCKPIGVATVSCIDEPAKTIYFTSALGAVRRPWS